MQGKIVAKYRSLSMRKIIVSLILLCVAIGLSAQEASTPETKFGLLSASVYNLEMRLSTEMQRLYVSAEFSLDKAKLSEANYHSLFLNEDARLEQIKINNVVSAPILTTNLVPEHFNPVLPVPALLDSNSVVICYSFNVANIATVDGMINFKIKYWLPLSEWIDNPEGYKCAGFMAEQYWFPRNLEGASTVNTKLLSSTSFKLELGADCTFTDKDGIRTHRSTYQDSPENLAPFKLIKG